MTPNAGAGPPATNAKTEVEPPSAKAVPPQEDRGDADETATLRGSIRGKSHRSFPSDEDVASVVAE